MRKANYVAVAIVAALALTVGAFAYPVVAGTHPLAVRAGTPATVSHPRTADGSSGNETNETEPGDHEAPPTNDTENGTAENETSDHEMPTGNETENETEWASSHSEANDTENDTGDVSGDQNLTAPSEDTSSAASTVDVTVVESALVSVDRSIGELILSGAKLLVSVGPGASGF